MCVLVAWTCHERERHSILHLVDITAPRLGTASREDEVMFIQFLSG